MSEITQTEGVVLAGEVVTRVMREAIAEEDYRNSWVAGATWAYKDVSLWIEAMLNRAGPYDDVRALREFASVLGDKIREAHTRATDGINNGH